MQRVSSCLACPFLLSCLVGGEIWSFPNAPSPDSAPVVEVRLAPPEHALPQVSAEVGVLEQTRESFETGMRQKFSSAFADAMKQAKTDIDSMTERTMSVLQAGRRTASFLHTQTGSRTRDKAGQAYAIKLSLSALPPPEPEIESMLENIENKRTRAEQSIFDQAQGELQGLINIVLNELGVQIHAQVSALRRAKGVGRRAVWLDTLQNHEHRGPVGLPSQANVRVAAADDAFPTVADLAQEMEERRDTTESQDRTEMLSMELKLLQAANNMIKEAVSSAVLRLMA